MFYKQMFSILKLVKQEYLKDNNTGKKSQKLHTSFKNHRKILSAYTLSIKCALVPQMALIPSFSLSCSQPRLEVETQTAMNTTDTKPASSLKKYG